MKLFRWVTVLALAALLLVAGCGGSGSDEATTESGGSEDDTGAVAEETGNAEEIYSGNCVSCHGGNLEGGAGPALETVGANLSQEEIAGIIQNGKGGMPAMSQLGEDEVQELASWLAKKK